MTGFIAMDRSALDHPLLKDARRFRAWFWIVAKACWKPARFDVGGQIITLERGQLSYAMRELAEQWSWSRSAVGRFMKRLETEGMVKLTRTKSGTARGTSSGTDRLIITICNYSKYQDATDSNGTTSEPQSGTKLGQQRDIKEPLNQETKDISSPNGDGRAAPKAPPMPSALDMAGAIFRTGLMILSAAGHTDDRKARSIIGRWRKTYSDGTVLAVLARCQTAQPSEPLEWVTKALQAEAQRAAGQASHIEQRHQRASVSEIGARLANHQQRIAING